MSRRLCSRCLESFEDADLLRVGTELLCTACWSPRAEPAPMPAPAAPLWKRLRDDAAEWCRGRWWFVRAPILVWFGSILVRHWSDPDYQSLWKALNLGIHELGHIVFRPFGMFVSIAGGSLLQCLAPVIAIPMFFRQRDYFAIMVCLGWLSTNFFDVAVYAGDARAQALPLVSVGGGEVYHDWNYLLGHLGMLGMDATVALVFRIAATASMGTCLAGGAWLMWEMARTCRTR